jgi:hypothetical protein
MLAARLILRGADAYEAARFAHIFNARRPDREPAGVVIAHSEDDVVEGVRLAREHALEALAPLAESPFLDDAGLCSTLSQQRSPKDSSSPMPFNRTACATSWIRRGSKVNNATALLQPNNSCSSGRVGPRAMPSLASCFRVVTHRTWRCRYAPRSCAALTSFTRVSRTTTPTNVASRCHEALEPFTVGQYWGDPRFPRADARAGSDQTEREVKTLTGDAWARLRQIRAERDPSSLFVDYLAGPGGFRNLNGWEKNDD